MENNSQLIHIDVSDFSLTSEIAEAWRELNVQWAIIMHQWVVFCQQQNSLMAKFQHIIKKIRLWLHHIVIQCNKQYLSSAFFTTAM